MICLQDAMIDTGLGWTSATRVGDNLVANGAIRVETRKEAQDLLERDLVIGEHVCPCTVMTSDRTEREVLAVTGRGETSSFPEFVDLRIPKSKSAAKSSGCLLALVGWLGRTIT